MAEPVARPDATRLLAGTSLAAGLRASYSTANWLATVSTAVGAAAGAVVSAGIFALLVAAAPLLIVALVGLPLLWFAFACSHTLARLDRARFATYQGEALVLRSRPHPQRWLGARLWAYTKTKAAWLELAYAGLVQPVLTWASAIVVFAAWGGGLAYLVFPAYGWATAARGDFLGMELSYGASIPVHMAIGAALLLAAPWLGRGATQVQLVVARAMLSPSEHEALVTRVETLADTRSRMVAAADAERRRIERDLHDGAQQRLVALAMALGRAKSRLDADPDGAKALVDESTLR